MTKTNQPGLNLADLAPMSEDIPVGNQFLTVNGISARDGLEIFKRFPKLLTLVGAEGFNLQTALTVAPDAVAAIIATATGHPGDEDMEEKADRLPIELQFDILEAIGRLTFTRGFAPFVERIMALVGVDKSGSFTKAKDTNSPSASKPSSQPGTLPK